MDENRYWGFFAAVVYGGLSVVFVLITGFLTSSGPAVVGVGIIATATILGGSTWLLVERSPVRPAVAGCVAGFFIGVLVHVGGWILFVLAGIITGGDPFRLIGVGYWFGLMSLIFYGPVTTLGAAVGGALLGVARSRV